MPIRLVAKTFPVTAGGIPVTVKSLNTRQFRSFAIDAQEFSASTGGDLFDNLVDLLDSVIVRFKDDYEDEDGKPLNTVKDILWALDMNVLNDMCKDIVVAVKLGESESKNLNSSPVQATAESAGNVETAAKTEKEPVSSTRGKTVQ